MAKMKTLRRLLVVLIVIVPCLAVCAPVAYVTQQANSEADTYNSQLEALGIEPSIEGVEMYIWRTVQPGTGKSRKEILEQLEPLGRINLSRHEDCESINIGLLHIPGSRWGLIVPPSTPPSYRVIVCYSEDETVSRISDFIRMDEYVDGFIETVEARSTSSP